MIHPTKNRLHPTIKLQISQKLQTLSGFEKDIFLLRRVHKIIYFFLIKVATSRKSYGNVNP